MANKNIEYVLDIGGYRKKVTSSENAVRVVLNEVPDAWMPGQIMEGKLWFWSPKHGNVYITWADL
jgi:hypothetical protein